jgi:hypothetical protein
MTLRRSAAVLAVSFVSMGVGACSSTLKATPLNAAGRFETSQRLSAADVTVKRPFDRARDGKMAYVDTKASVNVGTAGPAAQRFFYDSIVNSKVFDKAYDSEGIQRMVIAKGISGFNDNLVGLHDLSQKVGDFLIVEPSIEWKGGYNFAASLKVTDATTAETVFEAHDKAFNWAGLDKPLLYPLFNAFIDWTQGVAPPPAPAPTAAK